MEKNYQIEDAELGTITWKVNAKARRMTFRTKPEGVFATVPTGTTQKEVEKAIETLRPKLLKAKEKAKPKPLIDLNYRIDAEYFKLSLVSGNRERFLSHSELGEMRIICPPNADFNDTGLQEWLKKVIVEALRRNAKIVLPPRLYMLSMKHGLPYEQLKINSSKGRWGSCSAKKHINLSCYLMLLPSHLIDYVLLHELAHTKEMNHSEKFWALLDKLTDGKAKALRKELMQFNINI